jgi:hypothetical protein
MQILTKDTTSTIHLTLTEMSELTTPVYLFRLISDFTSTEIAFIGTDISSYPIRYNEFALIETASPDLLDNEYELNVTGFYLLEVYEQVSATNLDYTLASKLLHTEKVRYETTAIALDTTYTVYNPTEAGVIVPPSPVAPGGTFVNSDATYSASVASGGTTIGADITVTDSDGSTFTSPSNKDITCTPATSNSGILYQRPMITGSTTSFANYDDSWQTANGTHDYTKVNPATIARLDHDNTYPFHFLTENNAFGNLARFTDENGDYYTNPYDSTSGTNGTTFSTLYAIDHLTGLGWRSSDIPTLTTWANALINANAFTYNSFTDWRLTDMSELYSIMLYEPFSVSPGTAQAPLDYYPFNEGGKKEYWSSTTVTTLTVNAYTLFSAVATGLPLNINREVKTNTLAYFICRNHYT